jgi:hypothetical protein
MTESSPMLPTQTTTYAEIDFSKKTLNLLKLRGSDALKDKK